MSENARPKISSSNPSFSNALEEFNGLGLVKLLEADPRPSFVLDLLRPHLDDQGRVSPVFSNKAFKKYSALPTSLHFEFNVNNHTESDIGFRSWCLSAINESFSEQSTKWIKLNVDRRWRVVSGDIFDDQFDSRRSHGSLTPDPDNTLNIRAESIAVPGLVQTPSHGKFNWITAELKELSPFLQFVRNIDWARTPLGPIQDWTPQLRQLALMVMADPLPVVMYYGPELTAIYNESFIDIAAHRHPSMMGTGVETCFADQWEIYGPQFKAICESGKAKRWYRQLVDMNRYGKLTETYYDFTYIPIIGERGDVVGFYEPVMDSTMEQITERRINILLQLNSKIASASARSEYWDLVMEGLRESEYDLTMVLLYSVEGKQHSSEDVALSPEPNFCHLRGSIGVPEGHPARPEKSNLGTSEEGFVPFFREAAKQAQPIVLRAEDGSIPEKLIEGIQWRGFGEPSSAVVVCPIRPTVGDTVLGFLVFGANPRRPYNHMYENFVTLLSRQLASTLASTVLREEELEQSRALAEKAAFDRARLSEQLQEATKENEATKMMFTRFADLARVGICVLDTQGAFRYCNDRWYEITSHPKDNTTPMSWLNILKDEDIPKVQELYHRVITGHQSVEFEMALRKQWQPSEENTAGEKFSTWIVCAAHADKNGRGEVQGLTAYITDISKQKWAEGIQTRRMEDALERKRQQEEFIDMTSHEMRNPLSAILHCADSIIESLQTLLPAAPNERVRRMIADGVEAAQTIAYCTQHQKRIVDDILILSRLDSELLQITPVAVQPTALVKQALQIFEGEANSTGMKLEFVVDRLYNELKIDWVMLDPSRLLQILINLITNAIKFTQSEKTREIVVRISCSQEKFPELHNGIRFFPSQTKHEDLTENIEWGNGEPVYLSFAVQDTGLGLSDEEKHLLFMKFSQTSPRTHVKYGGSGLGLYICRQLAEKQGGEVGVASQRGEGSTFAFFVKSRRCDAPSPAESRRSSLNSVGKSSRENISAEQEDLAQAISTGTKLKDAGNRTDAHKTERLSILVVEDNIINQKVLKQQLLRSGFSVEVANHGQEALDFLQETTYYAGKEKTGKNLSVVLMDIEMPVMNGLTCVAEIRRREALGEIRHRVPVIAITANVRQEQIDAARAAGMDDVITKPFKIPDLVNRIEKLRLSLQNSG